MRGAAVGTEDGFVTAVSGRKHSALPAGPEPLHGVSRAQTRMPGPRSKAAAPAVLQRDRVYEGSA